MKKNIWIVGLVVVVGAVLLIGRQRAQEESAEVPERVVSQVIESATNNLRQPGTGSGSHESEKSVQSVDGTVASGEGVASTKKDLSDAVKILLGLDGQEHNYSALLKAINDLGYDMSSTDVAALREMLLFANDRFPKKMRPIEINAVKNDVLDLLLRQKQMPEGLGQQMVEMAQNSENDPVWRDYCVQFMQPFYERVVAESGEQGAGSAGEALVSTTGEGAAVSDEGVASTKELTAIHDAMFSALDERDSTISGTALIGLENLSRTHDEFDREAIVAKASEIASDETASAASRMTALRLAAMSEGSESAVGAARSLAQTGATVLLRSAAIVTLGEIGTANDRELLESYLLADNRQIAAAAKMALAKMDAR